MCTKRSWFVAFSQRDVHSHCLHNEHATGFYPAAAGLDVLKVKVITIAGQQAFCVFLCGWCFKLPQFQLSFYLKFVSIALF
jgi:hypothetical protein